MSKSRPTSDLRPPTSALQFLFIDVDGATWDEHAREYVVPIRSRHDSHLVAEERHKFRAQAIDRARQTAIRIEATADLPSVAPVASSRFNSPSPE